MPKWVSDVNQPGEWVVGLFEIEFGWSPGFSRLKPGLQPTIASKLTHYRRMRRVSGCRPTSVPVAEFIRIRDSPNSHESGYGSNRDTAGDWGAN